MALTITSFPSYSPDFKLSFTNTEYDLSEYQNKLASRRDENSLFLRRAGLPGMKKQTNKACGSNFETDSSSLANNKLYFVQSLNSHNSQQIISLYNNFISIKESYLPILASDEEIINSLINAIISYEDFSLEALSILFDIVSSVISVSSDQVTEKFINEIGLTLSIIIQNSLDEMNSDMLENGCENSKLLPLILKLLLIFTSRSIYSRSAMISFGVLNSLVLIASKNINDDLTNQCLFTIHTIFSKNVQKQRNIFLSGSMFASPDCGMKHRRIRPVRSAPTSMSLNQYIGRKSQNSKNDSSSEMDFEIDIKDVESIIDPLFDILHMKSSQGENLTTINLIISIFVELTNIRPILIKKFYENGLFQFALISLSNPELTKTSLNLIGNLPIYSSISFIQNMIENGLFIKLMELVQNVEYTSDVYWVLSNFLEATPQFIIPLINADLVNLSVEIADQSSFHVKREIAYFLSTMIVFVNNNTVIKMLSNEKTFELIAEMLNSGVENLMIRCIVAFQKILGLSIQINSNDFNVNIVLQLFDNNDVCKQLDEIVQQIDQSNSTLISIASKLLSDIQSITSSQ